MNNDIPTACIYFCSIRRIHRHSLYHLKMNRSNVIRITMNFAMQLSIQFKLYCQYCNEVITWGWILRKKTVNFSCVNFFDDDCVCEMVIKSISVKYHIIISCLKKSTRSTLSRSCFFLRCYLWSRLPPIYMIDLNFPQECLMRRFLYVYPKKMCRIIRWKEFTRQKVFAEIRTISVCNKFM